MTSFRPHPFSWRPGSTSRHATTGVPADGQQFQALCGSAEIADTCAEAWFLPTCAACNVVTHELAGVPMPPAPPVAP
ncbi:zinc finger protein [Saccharopolyspora flava]|uniref:zinc finger protein n=1 Tax=Saccharopolyspora flava TaxID=95161 RepID=UPI001114DCEC|nr:zinc finger protein [Saccharopolyspora flava]